MTRSLVVAAATALVVGEGVVAEVVATAALPTAVPTLALPTRAPRLVATPVAAVAALATATLVR